MVIVNFKCQILLKNIRMILLIGFKNIDFMVSKHLMVDILLFKIIWICESETDTPEGFFFFRLFIVTMPRCQNVFNSNFD